MIRKIGVLGAGTMGHGIAEVFALYGYDVKLYDNNETVLNKAKEKITQELALMVEEDFIPGDAVQETLDRISTCTDLRETVQDRDYVIEAVPEIMELKQELFRQLDEYCPPATILASNTSSLPLDVQENMYNRTTAPFISGAAAPEAQVRCAVVESVRGRHLQPTHPLSSC